MNTALTSSGGVSAAPHLPAPDEEPADHGEREDQAAVIYGTYPTGTTGTLAGPWVYAVQTQSAGLARGGWPRSGHDNQSSGDVATLP